MDISTAKHGIPTFLCEYFFPSFINVTVNELILSSPPLSAPRPHPIWSPLLLLSHFLFSYTPAEKEGLKRMEWFSQKGGGYFAEQSTQPQTLGYSLADSPVGLLSWIYEKLVLWTDNYPWEDDEGKKLSFLSISKG